MRSLLLDWTRAIHCFTDPTKCSSSDYKTLLPDLSRSPVPVEQETYSHHTYPQTTTLTTNRTENYLQNLHVCVQNNPTYLCSLVKPYEPFRGNMRCANKLLLTEHKSKNLWGARLFTISAAKAWNTLPNSIRASQTVGVFKTPLKTHLFKAYFE